jgi:phosphomannomutase
MAEELGSRYAETLTGFKWIANRAITLGRERGWRFVFGYEEALGYTVGELVRDKDGVGAVLVFADLAAFCRARGESVLDYLEALYRRFGLYVSAQKSVTLPGSEGLTRIRDIMERFRGEPLQALAGRKVLARSDLREGIREDLRTADVTSLDFPESDVLVYELEGGARVLLRPSGTEPKIKYYFEAMEEMREGEPWSAAEARAAEALSALMKDFQVESDRRQR